MVNFSVVTLTTRTSLILWPLLNLNRGGGHSLFIHGHCGHSNSVWSLSLLGRSYSGNCSTSIEGVVTHCLFMVTVVILTQYGHSHYSDVAHTLATAQPQ